MKIESNRIYINGFLQPLESEHNKNYISYAYGMIPNHIKSESYRVDIDGLEDRVIDNNELENIMSILSTKYRNKDLKDFKEKNKAFRFLVSKGFNFDDINKGFTQVE